MRASLWPTRPLNGWKGGRWRERNGGGGGGRGGRVEGGSGAERCSKS